MLYNKEVKNMKSSQELNIFLTNDYIYIPYEDKNKLNLRNNNMIYKNDEIGEYFGKKQYSPVSGKAYGLSSIYSFNGPKNVLIIENDFIDKTHSKIISNKDIYDLEESYIIEKTRYLVGETKYLVLEIIYDDKYDIKDEYLLKDNIKEILETLNIIDNTYNDITVSIRLDKRDIISYQTIFSYLGTYPNIEVEFKGITHENEKTITIYDVIDVYDLLKNRNKRDYIYVTIISNNTLNIIKTKRNSNLKDILEYLNLMSTKILINGELQIENGNFLLDETIRTVNIM